MSMLPTRGRRRAALPTRPAAGRHGKQGSGRWDPLLLAAAGLILISVARLHTFFAPLAALRPALLLSAVAVPLLLVNQKGSRRLPHLGGPLGHTILFLFVWAGISAPFALYPGLAVRTLLNDFYRTGVVVLVIASAIRGVEDLRRLMKVLALGTIAFAVLGHGSGFRNFGGGGYDPNDGAMLVVAAVPLVLYFAAEARRVPEKVLFALGVLPCGSAVVLSGSRGGFLGLLAVGAFALFGFRNVRPAVRVAVLALMAGIIAVSGTSQFWSRVASTTNDEDYNFQSVGGRIALWKRGLEYTLDHPVTGVGIANFPVADSHSPAWDVVRDQGRGVPWMVPHSIWVQAASELGLPGLSAFVLMFVFAFRELRRPRLPKELVDVGRPLLGMVIGVAVAGTFLANAYSSILWGPFALVLAFSKLAMLSSSGSAGASGKPRVGIRRRRS